MTDPTGTDSALPFSVVAKRSAGRSSVSESVATLKRRFDELETLAYGNRRILDLQFTRIADMQAEIDQVMALLKRNSSK